MPQKNLAFNPYMPFWEYVPDGEPHVFDDRLYVYGSHDRQNGDSYCLEDYVVWSAPVEDLSDWRCEGVSYRRDQDPHGFEGDKHLAAPDCAQGSDGRYYLYYCMASVISVAVADVPAGPFEYLGDVHAPGADNVSAGITFDPAILCDDDGRNWLYYGYDISRVLAKADAYGFDEEQLKGLLARSGAFCVELEDDMLTCKGDPVKVAPGVAEAVGTPYEGHAFFEASSMRRVGDRYYFVYSSTLGHELCYAVGDAPCGPFEYGGTLVSNVNLGFGGNAEPRGYAANTHGGMVCAQGQWYVFYHRHTHKLQFSRQACAEPIEILSDGSISQVEATSCGLNGGPLPAHGRYPAHIACEMHGPEGVLQITTTQHRRESDPYFWQEGGQEDGCMYLANMQDGASAMFRYFDFDDVADTAADSTACDANAAKTLRLTCRGDFRGTVEAVFAPRGAAGSNAPACTVKVEVSGSSDWQGFEGVLPTLEGVRSIELCVRGAGTLEIKAFALLP